MQQLPKHPTSADIFRFGRKSGPNPVLAIQRVYDFEVNS